LGEGAGTVNFCLVSLDVQPGPKKPRVGDDIPFYCLVTPENERMERANNYESGLRRVLHITELKNQCLTEALARFPETSHVIMVESYYLKQEAAIKKLIRRYKETADENLILGAPVWIYLKDRLLTKQVFYDGWACPELAFYNRKGSPELPTLVQVSSVGSCLIFPRWTWEKTRFANPEYPAKIYYNWLCENSGCPVIVDMSISFFRCIIGGRNLTRFSYPWRVFQYTNFRLRRFLSRLRTGRR